MSKIITVDDINKTKFYQLPKAFIHNPKYSKMKNESKLAYSILRDLLDLSIENNWINEKKEVYVKLRREKLMAYLNIKGSQKMTQVMDELKHKELILEKQVGVQKCNEIYICIPDELDIVYDDKPLVESEKHMSFENQNSRLLKIKTQDFRKSKLKTFENQSHTKTNITKTNINLVVGVEHQHLIKEFQENICELKKTTLKKFNQFCEVYNSDFVKTVIEYSADTNIKSFAGFETIINSYINKNIITREGMINDIQKVRIERKKKYKSQKNNKGNFNNIITSEQAQRGYSEIENKLLGWE